MKVRSLLLLGCVAFASCAQAGVAVGELAPAVIPAGLAAYGFAKLGTQHRFFMPTLAAAAFNVVAVAVRALNNGNAKVVLGSKVAQVLAPLALAGYVYSQDAAVCASGKTKCQTGGASCYCFKVSLGAAALAAGLAYVA